MKEVQQESRGMLGFLVLCGIPDWILGLLFYFLVESLVESGLLLGVLVGRVGFSVTGRWSSDDGRTGKMVAIQGYELWFCISTTPLPVPLCHFLNEQFENRIEQPILDVVSTDSLKKSPFSLYILGLLMSTDCVE